MAGSQKTLGLWMKWVLVVASIVFFGAGVQLWAQEKKGVTRAELEKVADRSTVEITTTGRKSGQPHTKPIWFVFEQGHFYLQSGKGEKSDWYLNLKKNSGLSLKIGTLTFTGKAKFIDDEKESERIHGLFGSKYLLARAAGVVGSVIGHGKVVEVELEQ
ncbi:MAG: nitroreductase family deazaflavin-dependent oxidoreductase [Deltaproteobacteria bacterium]|nr:nitroreductase family deazaflavin-dependent oxidoreductase [Deltaproteobacteria bacterium]